MFMFVIREWREIVRERKTPIFYKTAAGVRVGSPACVYAGFPYRLLKPLG